MTELQDVQNIITAYFRTTDFSDWNIENIMTLLSSDYNTVYCLNKDNEEDVKTCFKKELEIIYLDPNLSQSVSNKAKKL